MGKPAGIRKADLRAQLKQVNVDVSPEAWVSSWVKLTEWLQKRSGIWGAYVPLADEAPIFELVKVTPGVDWVFPKVEVSETATEGRANRSGGGGMSFWRIGPLGFTPGPFTPEPASDAAPVASKDLTGLLIPALAFDGRGYRLGRGGGYYDRYLVGLKAIRVGVIPKMRLVPEVPTEEFDLPVDFLATEDGISPVG